MKSICGKLTAQDQAVMHNNYCFFRYTIDIVKMIENTDNRIWASNGGERTQTKAENIVRIYAFYLKYIYEQHQARKIRVHIKKRHEFEI